MSSYPVLGNRPIDQWKVTELKEELKKRKLKVNGLKDDLIKRLAEAIEQEVESDNEYTNNGLDANESNAEGAADEVHGAFEKPQDTSADAVLHDEVDGEKQLDTSSDVVHQDEVYVEKPKIQLETRIASACEVHTQDGEIIVEADKVLLQDSNPEKDLVGNVVDTKNDNPVPEIAVKADSTIKEDMPVQETNVESILMERTVETSEYQNDMIPEIEVSKHESKNECDVKPEEESQDIKVPHDDEVKLNSSEPSNQVSVVSPTLGFTVKSNSVSCDIISTNEKNYLKDNIIADNVKLELDVKPEMVQPSSSDFLSDGGSPHPMDVEKPLEIKMTIDEKDAEKATYEEMSTENDADLITSERLNLDRSSGDDSMEEDVLDNKQLESVNAFAETMPSVEKPEASVPMVVEEADAAVDIMKADSPVIKHEIHVEKKDAFSAPSVKRKPDQEGIGGGEGNNTSKRLRRWNTNNLQVERENMNGSSTVPKGNAAPLNIIKNEFSRSDSTASEGTPKERIVPPSPKPPSISLRIDRFLRPFTLKAVQELLGKTGTVTSFWMDHIKTHCYVTYSCVEEAMETRNAVYNLQWPPNGGRLLFAEFVDPQEVKMRTEVPPPPQASSATPVVSALPTAPATTTPRQAPKQQQLPPPPPLAKPLVAVREQLPLPPPPPPPAAVKEKVVEQQPPPILTLDDLFKKTKATPRIYYLPLSDEQVAAKGLTAAAQNGKKQH